MGNKAQEGFRVDSAFGVLESWVLRLKSRVLGVGSRVLGLGSRVLGLGF